MLHEASPSVFSYTLTTSLRSLKLAKQSWNGNLFRARWETGKRLHGITAARPSCGPVPFVLIAPKSFDEGIDEKAHLCWHMRTGLECNVHREPGQVPVIEYRHKAACLQVVIHDVFRLHEN